jgi:hypothetical protein
MIAFADGWYLHNHLRASNLFVSDSSPEIDFGPFDAEFPVRWISEAHQGGFIEWFLACSGSFLFPGTSLKNIEYLRLCVGD